MLSQSIMKKIDSATEISQENKYISTDQNELELVDSTGDFWEIEKKQNKYIYFPKRSSFSDRNEKQMEWWVGHVESIHNDYFIAVLEDLKGVTSIAEFEIDEVSPMELPLLQENARFTYTVTQVDKHTGREYTSKLAFSGTSLWTECDSKKANESFKENFPEDILNF